MGTCLTPRECDHGTSRQEPCAVRTAQRRRSGEDEQKLLGAVVDMQWRADGARLELVDRGGELPCPGLGAHGSDVASRESVRVPVWLHEVSGHQATVADPTRRFGWYEDWSVAKVGSATAGVPFQPAADPSAQQAISAIRVDHAGLGVGD
jgi:hypothetical protein